MPRLTLPRALGASIAALALGLAGAVVVAGPAAAANIPVTSNADAGALTLRQAVLDANAAGGADVIQLNFAAATTITLTSGVLTVLEGVEIVNIGAGTVTIASGQDDDLFELLPPAVETDRDFILRGAPGTQNLILDGNRGGGFDGHAITTAGATPINSLTLENMVVREFNGGGSEQGGAIRMHNASGNFSATDTVFFGNVSASSGGAISVLASGDVTITRGEFDENVANGAGQGGAMVVSGSGAVRIHESDLQDNDADNGGALAILQSGELTIDDGTFFGHNGAANRGGAVYVDQTGLIPLVDVIVRASTFEENSAGFGAGVYVNTADGVTFTDATVFDQNFASGTQGGGAVISNANEVDLTDTQWIDNRVLAGDGGAVALLSNGLTTIDLALFSQNKAENGGAIYIDEPDGKQTISNSMIADNEAVSLQATEGQGGGVYIGDTTADVDFAGTTFSENLAHGSITGIGGGIFISYAGGAIRVLDSTFTGNTLGPNGAGGISVGVNALNSGSIEVVNSTFDEAYQGSAAVAMFFIQSMSAPADLSIAHSTFVGRTGFQLAVEDGGDPVLTHSAFQTTDAPVSMPTDLLMPTSYSAFTQPLDPAEILSGAGNQFGLATLSLGPLQDNGNGLPHTREPLTGSPLINTGNPAVTGQPPFDERGPGFNRVVQVIDIGAVEVQHPQLPATGADGGAPLAVVALLALLTGGVLLVARRRTAG